jgi:hypothetical protein
MSNVLDDTKQQQILIVMRRYERASTLLTSNRLCGAPHKAEHFLAGGAARDRLDRAQ